jgi:uncharacterized protein YaaN involved in tellurite resistance
MGGIKMAITTEVPKEVATKKEVLEPFSLEVPDGTAIKKEILEQVKPVSEEVAQLQELAIRNVAVIMTLDIDKSAKRKEILQSIESFGAETMKHSAKKNSLIQVKVGTLAKDGDQGGPVAKGLMDLQQELKGLNPGLVDFRPPGILGKLYDPVRAYFAKFQKADQVIEEIIGSLDEGKRTLIADNKTLDLEQEEMRNLTKKLIKEVQLGALMDELIEKWIEAAKARNEDREKVKLVEEEILFPLRQRRMDMETMIAVNQQGVIAIELVIRNNKQLMRGVERAQVVTISALKTAVMVASALYNQKIVLNAIKTINETTEKLINDTSVLIGEQGIEIQAGSRDPSISVDTMKIAFANSMKALDAISTYKREALSVMIENINLLKELTDKGEERIQQLENGHKLEL